jgi:phage terminase large subunit-like protein
MRAGTKGRRQALLFEITNSGWDRESICWQHHEYSRQVLEGTLEDDEWFAYVCGLDPCEKHANRGQPEDGCEDCDDWRDEKVWPKSNPNLGVTIKKDYLRRQVREAEGMPAQQSLVKRLNFCIWTQGADLWLDAGCLATNGGELRPLAGRSCFGGLDLSHRPRPPRFAGSSRYRRDLRRDLALLDGRERTT